MSVNWNKIIQAQAHGVDPVTAFHREEERSRRESHERDIEAAVYRIRTNNYDPRSRAGLFPLNLPNYVTVSNMIAENPAGSKIKVFNTRSVYRAYPGIRPGEPTAVYIQKVLERVTLGGALFVACIAVLPDYLRTMMSAPFFFGGTSLLIVVGVSLDTIGQIESHLIMRHYEGFMKEGRIKGRWFNIK